MKKWMIFTVVVLWASAVGVAKVEAQDTAQAQNSTASAPAERNLKLMVRNAKGRVMPDLPLFATVNGSDKVESLDRFGNRFFRVVDTDTLNVMIGDMVYQFPVEGLDSLYIAFRNARKIEGFAAPRTGKIVNTGYGTISRRNLTSAVGSVDMSQAHAYSDLRSYIQGRVAGVNFNSSGQLIIRGSASLNASPEALIVVDGVQMSSFAAANSSVVPADVASIDVLKDAASSAIYGTRGANGVVVIITKSGK